LYLLFFARRAPHKNDPLPLYRLEGTMSLLDLHRSAVVIDCALEKFLLGLAADVTG
jgi:hypothetical protein